MKNDSFSRLHPAVNFMYFIFVFVITMIFMHPVILGINFCSAIVYSIYLNKRKAVKLQLRAVLPVILVTAIMNPLFNHAGETFLFYFNNGNPVTLEAISFGIASSIMFGSMILWFSCFNSIITSDKILYLFGKVIPSLSLLISMALRFIPKFNNQIKNIAAAQRAMGRDASKGNPFHRALCGMKIFSIAVTWALESSIVTADSMKARGHGSHHRTTYSIFRFDSRDKVLISIMIVMIVEIMSALMSGQLYVRYYPTIELNSCSLISVMTLLFYGVFCNIPMIINWKEDYTWRKLQSRI